MPSLSIIDVKCVWRQSPPFVHNRVIEITLPHTCPYGHHHASDTCKVYALSSDSEVVERLKNPIDTKTLLRTILKYYIPDPDRPHVNIVMFRGEFMTPENFEFINEFIDVLDMARVGMFVGAETYGSSDKERLPKLLDKQIIDELNVKMVIYPKFDENAKHHMYVALNSLVQAVTAVRNIRIIDDVPKRVLEKASISFLFTKDSSLDILLISLRAIFQAISEDEDIFGYINIYLRGDGSEPEGILEKAYEKIIEGFDPDRVYMVPIPNADDDTCIFLRS